MQGLQQSRKAMSVRLPESRYERLLTLQRTRSKEELRMVSCNEIICSMIRDYTARNAPTLELTHPSQRRNGAAPKVLSVRMPDKLYERLLRLQRAHSKEAVRTVSCNELIHAMINHSTGSGTEAGPKRKKSR